MKKMILAVAIFLIIVSSSVYSGTKEQPNIVISSVLYDSSIGGQACPVIAVDSYGKWRDATINDYRLRQKNKLYMIKNKRLIAVSPSEIQINSIGEFCGGFSQKLKEDMTYIGIYCKRSKIQFNSKESLIKPNKIDKKAIKLFSRGNTDRYFIKKVIKYDIANINKDFRVKILPNVVETMIGDINGDDRRDFILIVGETRLKQVSSKPVALICYVSGKGGYKRLPLTYWVDTSADGQWPRLNFVHDINGDKAEEIFISDCNSDSNTPMVYSWFKDGVKLVHYAQKIYNDF